MNRFVEMLDEAKDEMKLWNKITLSGMWVSGAAEQWARHNMVPDIDCGPVQQEWCFMELDSVTFVIVADLKQMVDLRLEPIWIRSELVTEQRNMAVDT
ncbi:hypothetical protein scyTo_0017003 [Scyliorhinus torazame]|uniref:Uncharacterized protein n=1 Tax=Scyliorhinus torazame TaxID=75743 RepID=A0A401Q357_SCYTO|nr:hypothetical protein [Scyliorhinus torazame]